MSVAGDGDIRVDGAACSPSASVHDVDTIAIAGTASPDRVHIDENQAPFAPGASSEDSGTPEIEISLSLGGGVDSVVWHGSENADTARALDLGARTNGDGDVDLTLKGVETLTLIGGAGDDSLRSDQHVGESSFITELVGGIGRDALRAGDGTQYIQGGPGGDLLEPGAGDDRLRGGGGTDKVTFARSPNGVEVNLQTGRAVGWGVDEVTDVESVTGSVFEDRLSGTEDHNSLDANAGDDIILGRGGSDDLDGGSGGDTLYGGDGDDPIDGDRGVDHCYQNLGMGLHRSCEEPGPEATKGFEKVHGRSARFGTGTLVRFSVEVQKSTSWDPIRFARYASDTLFDDRGWTGERVSLQRVDDQGADFRFLLASRSDVDRLCAPVVTKSQYSCFNEAKDRVVINGWRWRNGSPAYPNDVARYRRYVINHEIGHALGHDHYPCSGKGELAPVMKPQTAEAPKPCRSNPWPLAWERQATEPR